MTLSALGIFSAAGVSGFSSDYELIQTQVLSSNQSAITFSNLDTFASTYKHLQIRYAARSTVAFFTETILLRVNDISTTSYVNHRLIGTGSSVVSGVDNSATWIRAGLIQGSAATSNAFGAGVIDLLDAYASKNKTFRALSGVTNGEPVIALYSGAFLATTAISSFVLRSAEGGNFITGSRFSLYGIRG